jgi:hypothetical protein
MMQLPSQFAGIGHADRTHRAHAELDLAHRQPREALVAQHRVGIGILHDLRKTSRDFGPAMAKTPHCVVTSWISTQPPPDPMKSSADFIRKSAS